MMWNSKAVVFDLDDTLLSESNYFEAVLEEFCYIRGWPKSTVSPIIENFKYIRFNKRDIFRYFLQQNKKYWSCGNKKADERIFFSLRNLLFDLYKNINTKISPLDGAEDWIEYMQLNSCKIGVLTNGIAEAQYNKWRNLALNNKSTIIFVASRECGKEKPDSKSFIRISDKMGIGMKDITFVGDRFDNDLSYPLSQGSTGILIQSDCNTNKESDNFVIINNLSRAFDFFKKIHSSNAFSIY
jgi:putative hydrolase of the HAD superfamily